MFFFTLRHSKWNALSFTDNIAPIFLFVIGVSITLAYTRRLKDGSPRGSLYRKIIFRSLKIFAVGMFLNLMPDFNFSDVRWTGTLHRIAFVFLFCAVIFLNTNWKQQAWIAAILLTGYWLLLTLVPTPGAGKVMLEPGVNIVAWVDSKFLPGRMWQGTWDPESILSIIPSTVSGISGMLAGKLLISDRPPAEKSNYLMIAGMCSAIAGYFWGLTFPVNENLWTSSFVLVTSGFGALLLGALYFRIDIKGYKRWTMPGVIFGANAITRMIHGGVECGPNAVFVFKREGYHKTDFNFKDTAEAFGYKGTWKFFAKHWRFGLDEYRGAFSKAYFLKRLQKLIPSLQSDDIVPGRAGVRAMALSREGRMIDDFKIEARGNAIHVLNAPSPAATAALAIGNAIEEMATRQFGLG